MPSIDETIQIDAPIEKVFDLASDPEKQMILQSTLTAYHSERPEKGGRASGTTRVAGRSVEWVSEYTEVQAPTTLAYRSVESPMDFEACWTFTEADGGTDVRYFMEVPTMGRFFGTLADPIVARMYARDMRTVLGNLKSLAEET